MINNGKRHGMTDLYHGNHYDVLSCHSEPVERPFMERVFTHSTISAQFETPAIVRERWRSCLKILYLQTPGNYDDSRSGLSVFAEERAETQPEQD